MAESFRELFERMNKNELLSMVAFFQAEYAPETLKVLKEVALSMGITDEIIRLKRENCYADLELEFKCDKCDCELILDKNEFIDGAYTCPECSYSNYLNYLNLELPRSGAIELGKFTAIALGGLGGAIIVGASGVKKRNEKREKILDGTYWEILQAIAQFKTRS
jgi:hypothetical protein